MKMFLNLFIVILLLPSFSFAKTNSGLYASCQLTSGDFHYFSTCRYFSNVEQGINFCNNTWYNFIGKPKLTHVRSFVTSASNNTMESCNQSYIMFLNRNRPYSINKRLISIQGKVDSYRIERDVFAEDTMDI